MPIITGFDSQTAALAAEAAATASAAAFIERWQGVTASELSTSQSFFCTMTEGLVRGLWLLLRATNDDIARFKRGKVNQTFAQLITELEEKLGPANSSLQNIKHATNTFNDFTHTGFAQVSRRHSRGELKGSYPEAELKKALAFTGAMGMIAAAQLSAMSTATATLSPKFSERLKEYAARSKLAG